MENTVYRENQAIQFIINALGFDVSECNEIKAGFSTDKKFKLSTEAGSLLLRISDKNLAPKRKKEFDIINTAYNLGIKCSKPITFGEIDNLDICFSCFQFIEGKDAETILPEVSGDSAFRIGKDAGHDLKMLNEIRPTEKQRPWSERKKIKHENYVKEYFQSGFSFKKDKEILEYINSELSIMDDSECVFQHDDFHVGNIIVNGNRYSGVIDFNRMDWGDYAHDFVKLGWFSRYVSEAFANGQIQGYFPNDIPEDFWRKYSLYMAMSLYSTIAWQIKYFPELTDGIKKYLDMILEDHEYFRRSRPKWKD